MNEHDQIIHCHGQVFPVFLEMLQYDGYQFERGPATDKQMHTLGGKRVIVETIIRLPTAEENQHWTPSFTTSPPK